jgi:hypothetical protein
MAAASFMAIGGMAPLAKMVFEQRHNLLQGTEHVKLGLLARLVLGRNMSDEAMTADELVDYITARAEPFRWWQLRGPLFIPLQYFAIGVFAGWLVSRDVYDEPLAQNIYLGLAIGWFSGFVGYVLRTLYVPYQLLCTQVGGKHIFLLSHFTIHHTHTYPRPNQAL